jgi:hypothetical protein
MKRRLYARLWLNVLPLGPSRSSDLLLVALRGYSAPHRPQLSNVTRGTHTYFPLENSPGL